jgi:Xaa-Pro aminopeptidase
MSSGDRSHLLHQLPSQKRLIAGEVLRCDLGARRGGYVVDMARTIVIEESTSDQAEWYSRLWDVHEATIAAVRPGVLASDVYRVCVETASTNRLQITAHQVGHGIGLRVQEPPYLRIGDDTELEAGMVLAVEPRAQTPHGLFHVEDIVVVTETGSPVVSHARPWRNLPVLSLSGKRSI